MPATLLQLSIRDLLFSIPEVDAIDVCLPTYLHKEAVELAAHHGKHVFCEKPIALTVDDANAMISTCNSNGVKLGIAHVVRYFPEYEMAHDMIASAGWGQIGVVRFSRTGPFPKGWNNWYADFQLSKGVFVDLSIHDFDFLNWCFGPVERVQARKVSTERPMEYGLAVVRMKSGVIAHVRGQLGTSQTLLLQVRDTRKRRDDRVRQWRRPSL